MNSSIKLHLKRTLATLLMLGALVTAIAAVLMPVRAIASSDQQIILSGTGPSSVGRSGFWLWSQTGLNNQYGNGGQGNMYFYDVGAHGLQQPVDVTDGSVVVNGNVVTEHEESADGRINCDFTATETSPPSNHGPANGIVSFVCSAPSGAFGTYPAHVIISNLSP